MAASARLYAQSVTPDWARSIRCPAMAALFSRIIPILFVGDLQLERRFYESLGFHVTYEGPEYPYFLALGHGKLEFGIEWRDAQGEALLVVGAVEHVAPEPRVGGGGLGTTATCQRERRADRRKPRGGFRCGRELAVSPGDERSVLEPTVDDGDAQVVFGLRPEIFER